MYWVDRENQRFLDRNSCCDDSLQAARPAAALLGEPFSLHLLTLDRLTDSSFLHWIRTFAKFRLQSRLLGRVNPTTSCLLLVASERRRYLRLPWAMASEAVISLFLQ